MLYDVKTCGVVFCAFALLVAAVNLAVMRFRATWDIRLHPEKKKGYIELLCWASLIYLPFFVPGLALITGLASSPNELFERNPPSPALIVFDVVAALAMMTMLIFVWFFGGLRLMLTHPAMFRLPWSPFWMKAFWGGMTVFAVVVFGKILLSDFRDVLK